MVVGGTFYVRDAPFNVQVGLRPVIGGVWEIPVGRTLIDGLSGNADALSNNVGVASGNKAGLSANMGVLSVKGDGLSGNVGALSANVAGLSGNVGGLSGIVYMLSSQVGGVGGIILRGQTLFLAVR